MVASLIVFIIFGTVFGLAYLHYSTRHKERLALIEKGVDASIFVKGKRENAIPVWKIIILNISLLLMSIGIGIFIGHILENLGVSNPIAYPAAVFLMAGVGLFLGFKLTQSLEKKEKVMSEK